VLATHPGIEGKIGRDTLAALVAPGNYLGSAPGMTRDYLKARK
jgi:hypothetical protein